MNEPLRGLLACVYRRPSVCTT